MPIIKSAKKRVRVAEKAAIRNSKTKRTLKAALKAFRARATGETQAKAQSMLDVAAKKGLIHKNKAARQKAQLARAGKLARDAAGAKPNTKAASSKSAPKKVASPVAAPAKKSGDKTTAAKKATTAKTAAKKSAAKK